MKNDILYNSRRTIVVYTTVLDTLLNFLVTKYQRAKQVGIRAIAHSITAGNLQDYVQLLQAHVSPLGGHSVDDTVTPT
jgi:hypothetical protein